MTKFSTLNALAVLLSLTILAGGIAASVVNWYSYSENWQVIATTTSTFNYTKIWWATEGVTTTIQATNANAATTYKLYDSSSSVWSTFKLVQAFVLIALLSAGLLALLLVAVFASAVRNKLLFVLGMNTIRIALLFVTILILVSLVIAFLGFIGVTNALSDDNPGCAYGYCRRFSDSTKDNYGSQTLTLGGVATTGTIQAVKSFGPIEGWFIDLALIPVAIVLNIIIVVNKFPIPVDSVTIGEAL